MINKRILFPVALLVLVSLACQQATNLTGGATPVPTAISTTAAQQPQVLEVTNPTISSEAFSANVPLAVDTQKKNPSGCGLPSPACNVADEEGVLGVDRYDDLYNLDGTKKNQSGIWTGGADHQTAQTAEVGVIIPEGSYVTAYAASFHIVGGGYDLQFNGCDHCAWGFLARGLNAVEHADRNLSIIISKYGAIGAMKYTRYPVEPQWAQFFSQGYLQAQAVNALDFDNCGIGSNDCTSFFQAIMDYNDGSLTILHFDGTTWEVVWTNVVK